MNKYQRPDIDVNTIALIDFSTGQLKDYCNNLWKINGSTPSIISDTLFGSVFQGNDSTYFSSTLNSLTGNSNKTIEFFIKRTGFSSVKGILHIGSINSNEGNNKGNFITATTLNANSLFIDTAYTSYAVNTPSDNIWHHVAMVYEGDMNYFF